MDSVLLIRITNVRLDFSGTVTTNQCYTIECNKQAYKICYDGKLSFDLNSAKILIPGPYLNMKKGCLHILHNRAAILISFHLNRK